MVVTLLWLLFITPKRWTCCCKWHAFWVNGVNSAPNDSTHTHLAATIVVTNQRFLSDGLVSPCFSIFFSNECGRKATRFGDKTPWHQFWHHIVWYLDHSNLRIVVVFPWYPSWSPLLIGFPWAKPSVSTGVASAEPGGECRLHWSLDGQVMEETSGNKNKENKIIDDSICSYA